MFKDRDERNRAVGTYMVLAVIFILISVASYRRGHPYIASVGGVIGLVFAVGSGTNMQEF